MTPLQWKLHKLFFLIGIICAVIFGYWWFQASHVPHYFHGYAHGIDIGMFVVLSFVMWQRIGMDMFGWFIGRRIQDTPQRRPKKGLKVAFITTFVPSAEPIDMLRRTLKGIKNVNYEHDTWVLDEGDDDRVKALCKELDVLYFTRKGILAYNTNGGKFAARTKGGNHNAWYHAHGHTYDIVAQIDTDFIPKKNFLIKTLGYFRDPKIAFVGTPQIYGNTSKSWVAKGAAQQTFSFYGPIMRGLSVRESSLLIGANHVIRVSALKEIGYYRAHLTEDLLTGMTLHSHGWKSVYVPEVLAIGEGPATWKAYFNQQMRWAFGCIDVFFNYFPELVRKMSSQRTIYYIWLQQFYFNGLAFFLGLVLLALYFVTGYRSADVTLLQLVAWGLPLYIWRQVFNFWMQRFNVREEERGLLLAGRLITIAVLPIYFLALIGVLRGKHLGFKVTPKGNKQKALASSQVFKTHLFIGLLSIFGLEYGIIHHHDSLVMVIWAVISTVSLLSFYVFYRVTEILHVVSKAFEKLHLPQIRLLQAKD
jgi:cellulose synthase (UDP-forming)